MGGVGEAELGQAGVGGHTAYDTRHTEHADRGRVPGRRHSDARHVQGQFSNLRNPPPIQHSNEARAPPGRKLTPPISSLVIF